MKALVTFLFLALTFSVSAKEACYDLENYGELCLTYNGATPINAEVQVSIYKDQELMETITTKGSEYYQGGSFCGGKEHDCWTIPGSFNIHATSAKYEVFLNLSRWMTINKCVRCSNSLVRLKEDKGQTFSVR
jgi:hypothetical protein